MDCMTTVTSWWTRSNRLCSTLVTNIWSLRCSGFSQNRISFLSCPSMKRSWSTKTSLTWVKNACKHTSLFTSKFLRSLWVTSSFRENLLKTGKKPLWNLSTKWRISWGTLYLNQDLTFKTTPQSQKTRPKKTSNTRSNSNYRVIQIHVKRIKTPKNLYNYPSGSISTTNYCLR